MAEFLQVTIQGRRHGHAVVATQNDFPAQALDLKDIMSVIRRNGLKRHLSGQRGRDALRKLSRRLCGCRAGRAMHQERERQHKQEYTEGHGAGCGAMPRIVKQLVW